MLILALLRGGAISVVEIANRLRSPLDVFILRKKDRSASASLLYVRFPKPVVLSITKRLCFLSGRYKRLSARRSCTTP